MSSRALFTTTGQSTVAVAAALARLQISHSGSRGSTTGRGEPSPGLRVGHLGSGIPREPQILDPLEIFFGSQIRPGGDLGLVVSKLEEAMRAAARLVSI